MTFATIADVSVSLMRSLNENEMHYSPSLLARAEALLVALVPNLVELATDTDHRNLVVAVEADMLARVFRNPDGILSETNGDYTYRLDQAVASGRLMPSDTELATLGRRAHARAALGELDGYALRRFPADGAHAFLAGG